MYNIDFECNYMNIDDEDERHEQYQKDFLKGFRLKSYEQTIISNCTSEIFNKIKDSDKLYNLIIKAYKLTPISMSNAMYETNPDYEYGVVLLFSYDYFWRFHKLLQKFYQNKDFTEEFNELDKIIKI